MAFGDILKQIIGTRVRVTMPQERPPLEVGIVNPLSRPGAEVQAGSTADKANKGSGEHRRNQLSDSPPDFGRLK